VTITVKSVAHYFIQQGVLFALVVTNYNFMSLDKGCQGRISDSGVSPNTELYKKLET